MFDKVSKSLNIKINMKRSTSNFIMTMNSIVNITKNILGEFIEIQSQKECSINYYERSYKYQYKSPLETMVCHLEIKQSHKLMDFGWISLRYEQQVGRFPSNSYQNCGSIVMIVLPKYEFPIKGLRLSYIFVRYT